MRWMDSYKSLLLFMAILLAGCSSFHGPKPTQYCNLLHLQVGLANTLASEGVQVIQVGEETQLILPADNYFYEYSNHMKSSGYKSLNHIVEFINTYPVVDVLVTGYSDNVGDYTRNLALSRAQAQAVADYLWQNGLNIRMLTACGRACHDDIANNMTRHGNKMNRRIEIDFRLPPPNNVFH